MKILVLCTHGKNRSRHLAEYLSKKGYATDFVGVNSEDVAFVQNKINETDVVVTVHGMVREKMMGRLDISGKRHIELDVEDRPELVLPEGKRLDGEAWTDFQRTYVYPKLEEQIDRYLPL